MALIKCKDCKNQISKSAETCPNCGKKQKEFPMIIFLIGCGLILFFIIKVVMSIGTVGSSSAPKTLSSTAPKTLSSTEEVKLQKIIDNSDDYSKHKAIFLTASKALVEDRFCSLNNDGLFSNTGGWWKSTTTYKNEPVYFTYCNPSKTPFQITTADRIYLNVSTGKIFQ